MEKLDLRRQFHSYYSPSARAFELLTLPPLPYLMIDGHGSPEGLLYPQAIQTLYSLAYTLKFSLKNSGGQDFTVMPLEALWWMDDMSRFSSASKDEWQWCAMILQPDFITQELFSAALQTCKAKGKAPLADDIRLAAFDEGECAQILFLGAYDDEAPTIARMHAWIAEQGCELSGKHHEIYLTDPSRVAPEKNKTILRQPIRRR
jgi:hypothetical protein